MKNIIIILAICSFYSCKKETTIAPAAAKDSQAVSKMDTVFKVEVNSPTLTYYEITLSIFDGDGRLQMTNKYTGSSNGRHLVYIKASGVTNWNLQTYAETSARYGATTSYGKVTPVGKMRIGGNESIIKRPEYYIIAYATGVFLN